MTEKNLYRYTWEFGRMGTLHGLFVSDQEAIDGLVGTTLEFGEVLGKHSEVTATVEDDDFEVVSTDQDKIGWLMGTTGEPGQSDSHTVSGYNPFDYVPEEYCAHRWHTNTCPNPCHDPENELATIEVCVNCGMPAEERMALNRSDCPDCGEVYELTGRFQTAHEVESTPGEEAK